MQSALTPQASRPTPSPHNTRCCGRPARPRASRQEEAEAKEAPSSSSGGSSPAPPRGEPLPSLDSPTDVVAWGGRLPSTRRAVLGSLTGAGIALGANFLGVTSALLGLDGGGLARGSRADLIFPVAGFKRCIDYERGYEFIYPTQWLGDQSIYRRRAARAEEARSLDPPSPSRERRRVVAEPSAAFGPAGGTGEENVSAISSPAQPGFQLAALGTSAQAGAFFLENIVAPEGSGRDAALYAATQREDAEGTLYYELEYSVRGPGFARHNVSVYAVRRGTLYTLNAQCPEERWPAQAAPFRTIAASFHTFPRRFSPNGTPDPLRGP